MRFNSIRNRGDAYKVELKKSHFGKQSFIECTLRYPLCQSEFNKNVSMASRTMKSDVTPKDWTVYSS